jgi:hypothetical protein
MIDGMTAFLLYGVPTTVGLVGLVVAKLYQRSVPDFQVGTKRSVRTVEKPTPPTDRRVGGAGRDSPGHPRG